MPKEDDAHRFEVAGPSRACFNWDAPEDKRAILACLVEGVYALQYDRVNKYTGSQALAPPWWTTFNYEVVDLIVGKDEMRINGAVFVWRHDKLWRHPRAPMVVLAFRGTTILKSDYILDYRIANQEVHKTARFTAAYNAVKNAVLWHGADNVCVTGHSLGAALALSAARMMALGGRILEAHLFNPPFSSATAPLESILSAGAYNGLQEMYTVTKAGLVNWLVDPSKKKETEAAFCALERWYPDLYVHTKDPVCSGFIGHFMNHQYMLNGKHGKLVMPHESIRGVLFSSSAQPHHLIPSARLHVASDSGKPVTAQEAHSLTQWWSIGLEVKVQNVNLTGQEHLQQLKFVEGVSFEQGPSLDMHCA